MENEGETELLQENLGTGNALYSLQEDVGWVKGVVRALPYTFTAMFLGLRKASTK